MKNLLILIVFATLLKIHKNYRDSKCACGFIGKSAVMRYHQLLSKVTNINRNDQLARDVPPLLLRVLLSDASNVNIDWH